MHASTALSDHSSENGDPERIQKHCFKAYINSGPL